MGGSEDRLFVDGMVWYYCLLAVFGRVYVRVLVLALSRLEEGSRPRLREGSGEGEGLVVFLKSEKRTVDVLMRSDFRGWKSHLDKTR